MRGPTTPPNEEDLHTQLDNLRSTDRNLMDHITELTAQTNKIINHELRIAELEKKITQLINEKG